MSENADIATKVKKIISEQLSVEVENITEDSTFEKDLGADSLDLVETVMEFEKEFEIDIPEETAEKIKTVKDAIDYITANSKS